MAKVEIKKQSSNEANVSQRHISYDIYVDGKYHTTTNDIIKAMDLKESIEKPITNTGGNMQLKNTAFTRGQMRALNAIQEKMDRVGIKAQNVRSPEQQNKIAAITKEIQDLEKQIEGQTEMSKRIQLIGRKQNLETERRRIKAENKEYVAFPGDNNPNSKVWYVGEGFGKSSTGVRYSSKAEAQAAADKHNRGIASAKEHEDWLEKQRWERESGAVRRAVLSRR